MAKNSPYEKLAQHVKAARQNQGWTVLRLAEEAFVSTKTVIDIEDKWTSIDPSKWSSKRKAGLAGSVIRLLLALKESDVDGWLKELQLSTYAGKVEGELKKLKEKKGSGADWILDEILTKEDLDFLFKIQPEFAQPMTIGFALELLRHKKHRKCEGS